MNYGGMTIMSEYVPKLVHLPGTTLTPEVVLHRTLNKLDDIKSVAVVIQWNDDTFSTDWSQMKVADMSMATYCLQKEMYEIVHNHKNTVK